MNFEPNKQIKLFRSIVDNLPTSTGVFDKEIKYLYINEAASHLSDEPMPEVLGKTPYEVLPKEICDNFVPLIKRSIQTKETVIERVEFNFFGNEVILNLTYIPMLDESGEVEYIIALTEDWTELEARRADAFANAKLASLGHMAANITHEINNPMQLIQLRLLRLEEMIHESDSKENMLLEISNLFRTTDRVSKIVESVRRQTKVTTPEGIQKSPIDELIEQTVIYSKNIVESAQTELTIEKTAGLFAHCNSIEIEQVLINLISNSCDAVSKEKKSWIILKIYSEKDEIIIQVSDSGLGIEKNIQKNLMRPFFTTKSNAKGTGLGLNLSKALVKRNAGQLSYLPGKENTTFEIRLKKA